MSQTAYGQTIGVPFAGLLADEHPNVVDSAVVAAATANISTGVFVKDTGNPAECSIMGAAGDVPAGIVLHRHIDPFNKGFTAASSDQFSAGDRVDLVKKGRIWVRCETAMARNLAATGIFVRYAAGLGTVIGAVRNAADASTCRTFATGLRVVEGASAAGVCLIEFDILMATTVAS